MRLSHRDAIRSAVTIEDQLATIIGQNEQVIAQLISLNEGVSKLATTEQITALNTAIDALEAATATEIGEINAKIDALVAAAQGQPDPALDAAVARLTAQREKIAAIVTPDAPADVPADTTPEEPTGDPV